jgi:hypothetical protein
MSAIRASRREVGSLSPDERRTMRALMDRYYHGIDEASFERDLTAKTCVFTLTNQSGDLVGFSTQEVIRLTHEHRPATVVFSGDTIIDLAWRRSWALPCAWGHWMEHLRMAHADVPLYWVLISKGFRTYRYLPVFFHRFAPRDPASPWETGLRHVIGHRLGGERYTPDSGIIRAAQGGQRLKDGVASVTPGRRRNPDIAFFEQANPGHAEGDELVCLAQWTPANVKRHLLERVSCNESPPENT